MLVFTLFKCGAGLNEILETEIGQGERYLKPHDLKAQQFATIIVRKVVRPSPLFS